jgi:TATA-box binding protein (TBP) (component of TFIID and TFIIIB)
MYFSNFIIVNQPHKGKFKGRLNLPALQKARPLEVSNNNKFPGGALKCNGVNVTLFNTPKFIMTGARNIPKLNGALRELADKVQEFLIDSRDSNAPALKNSKATSSEKPLSKRRRVEAY